MRAGRDGDQHEHAHDDPSTPESRALSAPADSYLPANDEYDYQEDSLAGYDPSQEERNLDGYQGEASGQAQYQEGEEEGSTAVSGTTAARSTEVEAGSGYGAPAAGSGEGEEGSGDAASRAEDDYAAPEGGYGAPAAVAARAEEEYGAPGSFPRGEQSSYNGFPFESVEVGGPQGSG